MEKIVDSFLNAFEWYFISSKKVKTQGYIELVDYQLSEMIELESKMV